jgi:hypothetical protein
VCEGRREEEGEEGEREGGRDVEFGAALVVMAFDEIGQVCVDTVCRGLGTGFLGRCMCSLGHLHREQICHLQEILRPSGEQVEL